MSKYVRLTPSQGRRVGEVVKDYETRRQGERERYFVPQIPQIATGGTSLLFSQITPEDIAVFGSGTVISGFTTGDAISASAIGDLVRVRGSGRLCLPSAEYLSVKIGNGTGLASPKLLITQALTPVDIWWNFQADIIWTSATSSNSTANLIISPDPLGPAYTGYASSPGLVGVINTTGTNTTIYQISVETITVGSGGTITLGSYSIERLTA